MDFQLVEKAPDEPGSRACFVTGKPVGPFVRIGYVQLHDLGCILIGKQIAEYIGKAIGWITVDEADGLRDELAAARAENAQLVKQLAAVGLNRRKVELAGTITDSFITLIQSIESWRTVDPPALEEVS